MDSQILEQITQLAELPEFTQEEIAITTGIEVDYFLQQVLIPGTPIYLAYNRGLLRGKAEYQQAVTTLAKNGSGPAQTLQNKLYRQAEVQRILNFYNAKNTRG